jgi:hypothetical protein
MCDIQQIWVQVEHTSSSLQYVKCGPGQIQCIYSSAYSYFNIQLNVSALLLEISRQFHARYNANLVSNIVHIPQFTLCELWFRSYTMLLELRTFRVQYSTERICTANGDISTIQSALYCQPGATYSPHPPVYPM